MYKIKNATLALGNFDGVHLGHRKMIQKAIDIAEGGNVYVCSFEPHPLQVLLSNPPKIITPLNEKIRIIEEIIGVKYFAMKFDMKFAKLTGEEFIIKLLETFEIKNIVVGANYYFGDKAKYSTKDLKKLGKKYSFNLYVVKEMKLYGEVISSTRIRECLKEGRVKEAGRLLGRNYCVSGVCREGKGLGKTIGFATANLETDPKYRYPKEGVYATQTTVEGKTYPSMTNVGSNPTVTQSKKLMIETHILGFDEVLYGKEICVEFVKRIRDQKEFKSVDELKKQLIHDKEHVKRIFN